MARAVLYSLINESCKQQTILLQDPNTTDIEMLKGDERQRVLRNNLLNLAEKAAPIYTELFHGEDFFSRVYTSFEKDRLLDHIKHNYDYGLALDIGTGTGQTAIVMSEHFSKTVGMDVSQHMQYHATLNAERSDVENVSFECHDVETGLPFEDASVSFVNINYGAASEFADLPGLVTEISRVLKPGGGLFMSLYNADAIAQKLGFLPWKTNMVSDLNPYTNCLEVNLQGEVFPIHARPYTLREVQDILGPLFETPKVCSYPFFSSVLPAEVLQDEDTRSDLIELEDKIVEKSQNFQGTYLICEANRV